MAERRPQPYALSAQQAGFIGGPVSISVGSSDANLVPSLVRAFGCRLSADRAQVTVFVPAARAQGLLNDLRAGGAIAAVFSRPSTHQTLQLKGAGATVGALTRGDRERMLAYGELFSTELRHLGYPAAFARALVAPVTEEALAASFVPLAAFEQTPGPAAGHRIEPGA